MRSRGWGTALVGVALASGFGPTVTRGQVPPRPGAGARKPAPPPPSRGGAAAPAPAPADNAAPKPGGGNPLASAPAQVGDLSTKFRFIERYTAASEKAGPDDIGQYRVALRDVLKLVSENPQGAPDRSETTVQIIYTERPAVVNASGAVTDTVRRYEALRVNPPLPGTKASAPRPLEGLTVWEKFHPNASPTLMSLTPGRSLSEADFRTNTRVVVMPQVAGALPALPSRVGDRWRLPRTAINALLGDPPLAGDPLIGTLVDVRKSEKGTDMVAVIGVAGRVQMPPNKADTYLNAQILFTFTPATPTPSPSPNPDPGQGTKPQGAAPVEVHGRITELRLAKSSIAAVPESNGRLRRTFTHELILQRPLNDSGAPLTVPEEPKPNPENSWLRFENADGRFSIRHPQGLQYDPSGPSEDSAAFVEYGPDHTVPNLFTIALQPKTGQPEADRKNRDPDFHVKQLIEQWKKEGQEVIRGPSAWLPEADWTPYKLKVFRIEAALKLEGASPRQAQRLFVDSYLILTARDESFIVTSHTAEDPPQFFRAEVEQIIRTIELGTTPPPRAR